MRPPRDAARSARMQKRRRENGKKDYLAGRRPKSGARTRKPDGYCGVSMKKTWTVLLAVLLLLGCAGCGARPAQAGTGALSGESNALNLNLGGDPQTLDPAYAAEQNGSYLVHLFEGLLTYNEDLELVPGAAESWLLSESEDGLPVYTFLLRADAKWSDGTPVTAQDFVFAWQRLLSPDTDSSNAYLLYPVKNARLIHEGEAEEAADGTVMITYMEGSKLGVYAADDRTLEVTLEGPCPYFLELLALPALSPLKEAPAETETPKSPAPADTAASAESSGSAASAPDASAGSDTADPADAAEETPQAPTFAEVYNGPYLLCSWQKGKSLTLVKNPSFHTQERSTPETLHFVLSEDEDALYADFQTGELLLTAHYPVTERDEAQADGTLVSSPLLGEYHFIFNTQSGICTNVTVRKALSLAVDRTALAEGFPGDGMRPAAGLVPYGVRDADGNDFREKTGSWLTGSAESGAENAVRLLKMAGYPDGEGLGEIRILTRAGAAHRYMAGTVAQMLRDTLSLQVNVTETETAEAFAEAAGAGEWDLLCGVGVSDARDPYFFLDSYMTDSDYNFGGFSDESYDAAMAFALSEAEDISARMKRLHEAEELLITGQSAVMPLAFYSRELLIQTGVSGVVTTPQGYTLLRWASVR